MIRDGFENNIKPFDNKRPDPKDPNYVQQLIVFKDRNYRHENGLPRIPALNPIEYTNVLMETIANAQTAEVKDGLECPKCKRRSAIRGMDQRRAGDEGQSLVLKCTNGSCKYVKVLSN